MSGLSTGLTGDIYKPARERIRSTLTYLAEMKNVSVTGMEREAIAEGVLGALTFPTLFDLVHGSAPAAHRELHWALNNCLDYVAARHMVELFHAASGPAPLDDHEFGRLMDSLVFAAKGPNPVGGPAVCWPAPAAMSWAAVNAFPHRFPRTMAGLHAALDHAMRGFGLRRFEPAIRQGARA
jgi:hypothetical protein